MFNNEFKQRFLDESSYEEWTASCIKHEFDKIEQYENLLNKDCSNFTLSEIIGYYKFIASSSVKTLVVINSYFKNYTSFAIRNKFVNEGINHYDELDVTMLKRCINSGRQAYKIFTQEELYKFIDESDCIASEQLMFLAAFEGIEVDELIEIKLSDIDNGYVKLNSGRIIPVSSKFIGLVEIAANEYEYSLEMSNITRMYKFDESDPSVIKVRIRKDTDTTKINQAKKARISKFMYSFTKQKNDYPVTYTSLKQSGRINMVKSLMEPGQDPYNCISKHREEIENKYPGLKNIKNFVIEFGDYLV